MGYKFSKFVGLNSQTAAEAILGICSGKDSSNSFLMSGLRELEAKNRVLAEALRQSKKDALTETANESDREFDTSFIDFRGLVRLKAGIPSLGEESFASAKLYDGIKRHGDKIEEMPRAQQMTAFDNFLAEFGSDQGRILADKSGSRPLFDRAIAAHLKLKSTTHERDGIKVESSSIPSVGDASKAVNPLLTMLYTHLESYASLGNPLYKDLLTQLDTKLAPISVQLKAEETRKAQAKLG